MLSFLSILSPILRSSYPNKSDITETTFCIFSIKMSDKKVQPAATTVTCKNGTCKDKFTSGHPTCKVRCFRNNPNLCGILRAAVESSF